MLHVRPNLYLTILHIKIRKYNLKRQSEKTNKRTETEQEKARTRQLIKTLVNLGMALRDKPGLVETAMTHSNGRQMSM